MGSDFLPKRDAELVGWMNRFVTACNTYATPLGISAGELASISAAADNFISSYDLSEAARVTAKAQVQAKDDAKRNSTRTIRDFVREFQANPNITNEMRDQLGITVPSDTRTNTPPKEPLFLEAIGQTNGINLIKFNRNNNLPGTQFVIEASYDGGADWDFAGVTTKTRFEHLNQTPGVRVYYRAFATRSGMNSVFSNSAVVYVNGGSGETELKIAA